jgi:hypothetical protein
LSVYASGLAVVNQSIYVGLGMYGALIFNFDPSLLHPSSMLLPVVIQAEPSPFPTTYEYVTPTPWDVAYTAQTTSTATSPEATVTPCRIGCTATPTPFVASPQLVIDIENDQPAVGDNLLAFGDIVDAANNGVATIQVVVTYSLEGGSGQWCQATTDSDGYWECSAAVTTAMQAKQVTLTAQATIGGTSVADDVVFQAQ